MSKLVAGVHLMRHDENADELAALVDHQGERVGVAGILGDLDRRATPANVPGRAPAWGFTWDQEDNHSQRWWPQGITTSADAFDRGEVEGRRLVVTSWYSKGSGRDNHGTRITVVDIDTLRYRHVLIVKASRDDHGLPCFEPVQIHAGGLVWFGGYLHLAGTAHGLYTCHLDDITKVRSDADTFGYRYVVPVRSSYVAASESGTENLRYSFLSLDRGVSPPELVAGEYGVAGQTTRLARYPLDPGTMHLQRDERGKSRPMFLDDGGVRHMQGAAVVGGTYYVTVSRGPRQLGHLYVGAPGRLRPHRWALPPGPEDISYWPARDQLWSLCEYPGQRFVYAIERSRLGSIKGLVSSLRSWTGRGPRR